jgi:mannose-1-phosphate guanylyltransferase/mannose-6-phosphate isomerase
MNAFAIRNDATILDAMQAIEDNKRRFLICVDNDNRTAGLVVDGDIRRALLKGHSVEDSITHAINTRFTQIDEEAGFAEICEIFKNKKIDFIPIADKAGKLINVVTKKQFHILMLEDVNYSPYLDFTAYDSHILEHEIYNRLWGFYKSTLLSPFAQAKVLTVFPDSQLSLQEHKRREEHWVVIKGTGKCVLGETLLDLYPGKYVFIPKGCKHQLINDGNGQNLILSEVQLGDYFGEDDIIRYEDKYGRI